MFIRLTDYVERGVIDNRKHDTVFLQLYLVGREDPVEVTLEGNCHKDIAGNIVQFRVKDNALGRLSVASPINPGQYRGLVGDMTASLKKKDSERGKKLNNVLHIEFFIDDLGVFVLEGNHCQVQVSSPEWTMDSCDEQAQIMCNQQVLRDYVQTWIKEFSMLHEDEPPLPDHHWDVRLREAEGVAIAYQEIHNKFRHRACGDTSEAFVMGWDDMLGELADSEENGTSFCCRISGSLSLFDILNDEEAIEAQLSMSHPIFQLVLDITETAQKLFAKEINALQLGRKLPHEELGVLFHSIRYVTPNILSCLLQINEGTAQYDVLAARMERCAKYVDKAVQNLSKVKVKGIRGFSDKMLELHQSILTMRGDLLNKENCS